MEIPREILKGIEKSEIVGKKNPEYGNLYLDFSKNPE